MGLYKKYNFLTYLIKEFEVGGGGNDFDLADKITASNFKQKKMDEETSSIEPKPEISLPKPNEVFFDEEAKKKLSEIIEETNAAYNENPDVVVVITMGCNVQCPSLPCSRREDWGFDDPTGQPDEVFLETIRRIEHKTLTLKDDLK